MSHLRPGRIVCVGDVMVDVLAQLPAELVTGSDRPAPVRMLGGGAAANTASWVAGIGGEVTLAGRIGDDAFGTQTATELARLGIDLALTRDPRSPTGCCIVLIGPGGQRTMVPDAGANATLAETHLPAHLFRQDRHLHLSGYTLFGRSRPAGLHALACARAAGMSISVDAASAAPIADAGSETFLDWVGGDVLLLANSEEATALTGATDPSAAGRILAERVGRAVVKLGGRGALWASAEVVIEVATRAVDPLDTTGAGDAFAAGLLVALTRGESTHAALATGNALAAQACAELGGRFPP